MMGHAVGEFALARNLDGNRVMAECAHAAGKAFLLIERGAGIRWIAEHEDAPGLLRLDPAKPVGRIE